MRYVLSLAFSCLISGTILKAQACQEGLNLMWSYKYNEAVTAFYACHVADSKDVNILANLAFCYKKVGNMNDAERAYRAILKIDSSHQLALLSLAQLAESDRNFTKAINYYDQLIHMDSTNAMVFRQKGMALLKKEKRLNAIYNFLKAYALEENDQEVIFQLARLYIGFDQLESAETVLEKGFQINPDNIRFLQLKAQLLQKQDKFDDLIITVDQLLTLGDSSSYYLMLQGAAYMQLDSFAKAIFPLQFVLDLGKENEFVHHYLAIAHLEMGEKEKSEHHFLKAIELGFSAKQDIFFRDYATFLKEEGRLKEALEAQKWAYKISSEPVDLFEIARMTDSYYADKNMAVRQYKAYLRTGDHKYKDYSVQRLEKLQEILHFKIK